MNKVSGENSCNRVSLIEACLNKSCLPYSEKFKLIIQQQMIDLCKQKFWQIGFGTELLGIVDGQLIEISSREEQQKLTLIRQTRTLVVVNCALPVKQNYCSVAVPVQIYLTENFPRSAPLVKVQLFGRIRSCVQLKSDNSICSDYIDSWNESTSTLLELCTDLIFQIENGKQHNNGNQFYRPRFSKLNNEQHQNVREKDFAGNSDIQNLQTNKFQTNRKLALIIGNNDYHYLPKLFNCIKDARLIDETLQSLGFTTTLLTNCLHNDLILAVKNFASSFEEGDIIMFYYSGHAGQQSKSNKQENYLFGVDAEQVQQGKIQILKGVKMSKDIIREFDEECVYLIVIDACRVYPDQSEVYKGSSDDLLPRNICSDMNLSRFELTETIGEGQCDIVYACQPGKFAIENQYGDYGFVASALSESLKQCRFWHDVLLDVKAKVYSATNGRQLPSVVSNVWARLDLHS